MEYNLAQRIGILSKNIIFNGPCKTSFDVQQALLDDATLNIDSPHEINSILKTAELYPDRQFRVGIRCNLQSIKTTKSRFGFDVQEKDFIKAFDRINSTKNCRISGLHCHFISEERSPEFYSEVSLQMISLAREFFPDTSPDFINIGGGFFSNMRESFKKQFSFSIPTFEEYASAIAPHFKKAFPGNNSPKLVIEPGLAIVADTMKFAARVIDIKKVQKRWIALLSGSIYNIKPTKSNRNLPIAILSNTDNLPEKTNQLFDLTGYTCMEDDIMFSGYKGDLKIGDYVLFDNVGAYTIGLKPPFISPGPAVLYIESDNDDFQLAKKPENFDDIFSTYVFK